MNHIWFEIFSKTAVLLVSSFYAVAFKNSSNPRCKLNKLDGKSGYRWACSNLTVCPTHQ